MNIYFFISFLSLSGFPQKNSPINSVSGTPLSRPKLVIGLMVDQMRWDFFYRYYDRYSEGGFKRLLREGFSCENTMIPYAQTVTAAGHASVYTGSVPAVNGIVGNDWYDQSLGRTVYCVEDDRVKILGSLEDKEPMSPRNLQVTTITDELRLATNFRSKVIGVAIKDRGSILPAGHTGDAYWYDSKSGNFVTSTYYHSALPDWAIDFNDEKWPDKLYAKNWYPLYPLETYVQSDKDVNAYEGRFMHEKGPDFPHMLVSQIETNYGTISSTPHGNTLTFAFAKAALNGEGLGKDDIRDFLAISLSSTDYAGHQFGPNSIEIEDMYLRLDKELESFFNYIDKEIGQGNWLFFITADHGVAHVPGFLNKHKIPASTLNTNANLLNKAIEEKFGISGAIISSANAHLYLNHKKIDSLNKSRDEIISFAIQKLAADTAVWMAFPVKDLYKTNLPDEIRQRFQNGIHPKLSGDIVVILKSGYFLGARTGTTHGSWYPYDAKIPLVFMGWGIKQGKSNKKYYMNDIASTLAALLKIQTPSGTTGNPIAEITD